MAETVWLLYRPYTTGTGNRVYRSEARAREDWELVNAMRSEDTWELAEVPFFDSAGEGLVSSEMEV